jgi:hypothetical protein
MVDDFGNLVADPGPLARSIMLWKQIYFFYGVALGYGTGHVIASDNPY